MSKYAVLSLSLILVTILLVIRFRLKLPKTKVLLALLVILCLMTLIFDFYLTALPIVLYNSNSITQLKILTIPIEDFSYTIAAVILVPSLFKYFNAKK